MIVSIEFTMVTEKEALLVWDNSNYATAFTFPAILQNLCNRVDWWVAWKGEDPICLWPACIADEDMYIPYFTYYVGPVWCQSAYEMPAHRWLTSSTKVYEGFINMFLKNYNRIVASFPVGLSDVRIFDWWNYHKIEQPRFFIKPRYTAYLDNLQEKNDDQIISAFRRNRRRELRSMKDVRVLQVTNERITDDIIHLYTNTLAQQGVTCGKEIKNQLVKLVDLVHQGHGDILAYKDPNTNTLIAAYLMLYGNKIANAIISTVDEKWHSTGLPAMMVFNSIKLARDRGALIYDFNGANSPKRGDDKHSYGAVPMLFFEIEYPGYYTADRC